MPPTIMFVLKLFVATGCAGGSNAKGRI